MNRALINSEALSERSLAFAGPFSRRPNHVSRDHDSELCITHSAVNARRINALCIVRPMHKEWKGLRDQHERLQWARENAKYLTPVDAAAALGMEGSRASTYFGHENGSRGLSRAGQRYAEFFRVSYEWLMQGKGAPTPKEAVKARALKAGISDSVPIVGRAGAGPDGSIEFSGEEQPIGEAPKPPGWTEKTVALEVYGGSMRPIAYDGWLVYYDDRRDALTPDMFGQPCVIWLENGHALIKIPYSGSRRGLFNLESANPAVDTMRDRRVRSAALVTAFIPRGPARRLSKG